MAALHVDDYGGPGEPLLFIHGWGMHGGMWGGVLDELNKQHRVLAVDLPGHGYSKAGKREERREKGQDPVLLFPLPPSPLSLDAIVDQLAAQFSDVEALTVCGWSLGGQIALRWAMRHPDRVKRLVLVSSTPCFVQQADWQCAMHADILAAFAAALRQDYAATLRRFLALQVRGSEQEREQLATLRSSLQSRGEPDMAALEAGLGILRDADLRMDLAKIGTPVLVIGGVRDTLTPMSASEYMAAHLPAAQLATIAGAAHAPFLSHRAEFVKHVADFLHE